MIAGAHAELHVSGGCTYQVNKPLFYLWVLTQTYPRPQKLSKTIVPTWTSEHLGALTAPDTHLGLVSRPLLYMPVKLRESLQSLLVHLCHTLHFTSDLTGCILSSHKQTSISTQQEKPRSASPPIPIPPLWPPTPV